MQVYRNSLLVSGGHSLAPLVSFLHLLVLINDRATGIIEAGVLDFLVHLYISGFSDPLALIEVAILHERSALRAACDSLLDTCLKSKQGMQTIFRHGLHLLWPESSFSKPISNRSAQRVELWRLMEPEVIFSRMESIFNMMTKEDWRGVLVQDSLDDIAADILEFLG